MRTKKILENKKMSKNRSGVYGLANFLMRKNNFPHNLKLQKIQQ